jgi:predicted nuclease of predicted toxin-antitoxin system
MKLLLDENISFRIKYQIGYLFDEIIHVSSLQDSPLTDNQIWEFAEKNNFIILTNDRDFEEMSIFRGIPPKVIIVKTGNLNKNILADKIKNNIANIEKFTNDSNLRILEIY